MADEGESGENENGEDPHIGQIDLWRLVVAALTNDCPDGASATITGELPAQLGGKTVSVSGIEANGKQYLACTNSYGTEVCVYDGFASPCHTNELATLLSGEGEEAEEAKYDWFR